MVPWKSMEKVIIPGLHLRKPIGVDKYSWMTVVSEEGMYTSINSKEVVCNTTFYKSTKSVFLEKLQVAVTLEETIIVTTLEEIKPARFSYILLRGRRMTQ